MPKPVRFITCATCGQPNQKHKAKGLCEPCYRRQKPKPKKKFEPKLRLCEKCGEVRPYHAIGLCKRCHALRTAEIRKAQIVTCESCGQNKPKYALGLCLACYEYRRYEHRYGPRRVRPTCCSDCGTIAEKYLRGRCAKCYEAGRNRSNGPVVLCKSCNELKLHVAHGVCRSCYSKANPKRRYVLITCSMCKLENQPLAARELCRRCYNHFWLPVKAARIRRRYSTDPTFRHKVIQTIRARKRRLSELGVAGAHTYDEWQAVLEAFDHRCAYCSVDVRGCATKDHVVPITTPGSSNSIENIVPACARCNSRKGTKSVAEFLQMLAYEKKHKSV